MKYVRTVRYYVSDKLTDFFIYMIRCLNPYKDITLFYKLQEVAEEYDPWKCR